MLEKKVQHSCGVSRRPEEEPCCPKRRPKYLLPSMGVEICVGADLPRLRPPGTWGTWPHQSLCRGEKVAAGPADTGPGRWGGRAGKQGGFLEDVAFDPPVWTFSVGLVLSPLPGATASVCPLRKAHRAHVRSLSLSLTPSVTLGPASRPLPCTAPLLAVSPPSACPSPPSPKFSSSPHAPWKLPGWKAVAKKDGNPCPGETSRVPQVGAAGRILKTGETPT